MSESLIYCALFLAGFLLCYFFDYMNTRKDVHKVLAPTLKYFEDAIYKCVSEKVITEEQAVKIVNTWKEIINKKGL